MLKKRIFDKECRDFDEGYGGSFREEYYAHKLGNVSFEGFVYLVDHGFFEGAEGDFSMLPTFTVDVPQDTVTQYTDIEDKELRSWKMILEDPSLSLRLFEQKFREAVVKHITTNELVMWFKVLRIREEDFTKNFPLFISRMMQLQAI